ncbi:protein YibQ [Enterobacter cancerogenus]|uniref:Protein YibQ n=1 Tax=Enterobacter cancerogenus TaxID=69218 RepID=A0A484ZAH9_9ENTR|nr:protein YibQ [Enterobacter cancerogenus]
MQSLERYNLYFLDSMTIGNSQAMRAAQGTGVKVIKRKVFLDDTQNEADIRVQFNRAVQLARRNGSAIAIGHPHPSTVRVLQQMCRRYLPISPWCARAICSMSRRSIRPHLTADNKPPLRREIRSAA